MVPGTSAMHRARRRDVNVKPNRTLDRSSSRGMIYENEELRLRTININAEVERSQNDIKKLRRENEQLKREIWQLREEYDKLETFLKEKQRSEEQAESEDEGEDAEEDEDEAEEDRENADDEDAQNQRKAFPPENNRKTFDNLSVVEEVEENSTDGQNPSTTTPPPQIIGFNPNPQFPKDPYSQTQQIGFLTSMLHSHGENVAGGYGGFPTQPGAPENQKGSFTANPALPPICPCYASLCAQFKSHQLSPTSGTQTPGFKSDNPPTRVQMRQRTEPGICQNANSPLGTGKIGNREFAGGHCSENCTSLGHKLGSLFNGSDYFAPPGQNGAGNEQEVQFPSSAPSHSQKEVQVQGEVVTTAVLTRRQSFRAKVESQTEESDNEAASSQCQCAPYSKDENSQFLRLNSVQPFTLTFPIQQFPSLTVQEMIDTLLDQLTPELQQSLKGVRMVRNSCFVSFGRQADMERVLAMGIKIKGTPVTLTDASLGTSIIGLSGIPHLIPDQAVDSVLSKYGCLVGQVERRVYKGVDIGERFVRIRPKMAIPRHISVWGHSVTIRVLGENEVSNLNISRRRSFRSQLNIRLKIPSSEDLLQSSESLNVADSQSISERGLRPSSSGIQLLPNTAFPNNSYGSHNEEATCCVNQRVSTASVETVIPTVQKFSSVPKNLGNLPNGPLTHSLPDFLSSNVVTTSAPYFTYPISATTTTQSSEPSFFQKSTGNLLDGEMLAKLEREKIKERELNTVTGPTPLPSRSTSCFQFPLLPTASQLFHPITDCQPANPSSASIPSSSENKKSSDKEQDSKDKKADKPGGKEQKKRSPKKGKQGKMGDRKVVVGECSQSSSSGQDSPNKSRRKLSVNFKRINDDGSSGGAQSPVFRTTSFDHHDGPTETVATCSEFERSNSETSSRFGSSNNCPRKMSATGREQKSKVPWCGCWGNGCC